MGNNFTKGNNVAVVLDRNRFYPGELVTGTIHLNLVEPAECICLNVKIKGVEVTHIQQDVVVTHVDHHHGHHHHQHHGHHHHHYGHHHHHHGHHHHHHHGHHHHHHRHGHTDVHTDVRTETRQVQTVFYKDSQQLHRWQPKEAVQPGHYQWRFAGFHLPTNAKPSSTYQSNDRTLGGPGMGGSVRSSVSYKVKAVVRRPGAFTANLRGTAQLTVLPGYIGAAPGGGTAVVVVQQPQQQQQYQPVPVPNGYTQQPAPAPHYPQPGAFPAPQQQQQQQPAPVPAPAPMPGGYPQPGAYPAPQQQQQQLYAPYPAAGAMPQAPAGYPRAAPAAPPALYGMAAPMSLSMKA